MSTLAAQIAALLANKGRRGIKCGNSWAHREKRAWAAGFFDGEGHVRGKVSMRATINQKDKRALVCFNHIIGGVGKIKKTKATKVHNAIHTLDIYGIQNVLNLFAALAPWIGEVKRAQFISAFTAYMAKWKGRWG